VIERLKAPVPLAGFSTMPSTLEHFSGGVLPRPQMPVLVGQVIGHRLDRDDIGFLASCWRSRSSASGSRANMSTSSVGQHDCERLVARRCRARTRTA